MTSIGWLDLSSGASGDMLLGALVGAGVPVETFTAAVAPLELPIRFEVEAVQRAGLAATRVHVDVPVEDQPRRTWSEIRELLDRLPDPEPATRVFAALARAEGQVHGIPADDVHFHEVGALDAVADVVATTAGFAHLGLERLVAAPLALGDGSVATAHGSLPVPGPAVLQLLRGTAVPTAAAPPGSGELCTPTGAALVLTLADAYGPMPAMTVDRVGSGAGAREVPGRPNLLRLVLGTADEDAAPPPEPAVLLEANVDDLDPRLWPEILTSLLAAGAADAWLTPILMKKGRPAHTLSVLADPAVLGLLRTLVYRHTSTLGVRERPVTKRPLGRDVHYVEVDGQRIAVKRGRLPDGIVVTAQPEWEDVAAAAAALRLPPREVLARAAAAARKVI